jgi:TetR/AcrR family transcriptional regulator, transcriptional repressor for nem operon
MARQKAFDETALLERAMELFWEQGYEATSVRDLTDHLQLSSSSLYNTYGGKRDLYLMALAAYRRVEYEQMQAQLAAAPAARETIERLFADLAAGLLADGSRRGSFTLNAAVELGARDRAVARQLQEHFADVTRLLADFLAAAQTRGEIGSQHAPRELATFLLLNLYSLAALVKVDASREQMEGFIDVALSVLDK